MLRWSGRFGPAADDRRKRGSARRGPRRTSRSFARGRAQDSGGRGGGGARAREAVPRSLSSWPRARRRHRPGAVRGDLPLVRRLAARAARPAADGRDLDADAITAYARFLETAGARGPAAPVTRRISPQK